MVHRTRGVEVLHRGLGIVLHVQCVVIKFMPLKHLEQVSERLWFCLNI